MPRLCRYQPRQSQRRGQPGQDLLPLGPRCLLRPLRPTLPAEGCRVPTLSHRLQRRLTAFGQNPTQQGRPPAPALWLAAPLPAVGHSLPQATPRSHLHSTFSQISCLHLPFYYLQRNTETVLQPAPSHRRQMPGHGPSPASLASLQPSFGSA